MNVGLAKALKPLITPIKKYIDKIYFDIYNVSGRENMIRNMFP